MKLRLILFFFFVITQFLSAQTVTWQPLFPTESDSLVVTFNAAEGSKGLMGYTGDVYAHTGVITNLSTSGTDWKYVKTNWGVNTPETKLQRIGTDLYQFVIIPSIRTFYNVPSIEEILNVAFVFRSSASPYKEGKTSEGGDIFVPVYEAGLNLTILSPSSSSNFFNINDTLSIKAVANTAERMFLSIDGQIVFTVNNDTLDYLTVADSVGRKDVEISAINGTDSTSENFIFVVNPDVQFEALPAKWEDGINYTGNSSASLVLLAPKKEFVYVIGDFNNWEVNPDYFMKLTPDSTKFWLEINGLTTQTEYAFQYFIDGEIKVVDPYAEKILDPWNDDEITSATYPNLKPYPAGKTDNIVGVLQTGQPEFDWQIDNFIRPPKNNLIIYEMLVRDFVQTHDYETLIDTLSYLKNLGINAIELMPVSEFEGNNSWGYNPMMYFAPDKYYGPKEDLKKFIDAAHQNGIAVLLDLVLNHAYDLNPMVRMYFDGSNPTADNPWFNQQSNFQNPDAQWGNDFNHESPATQYFVDRVLKHWLINYKFDGFRFDFTKGFGNNIKDRNSDSWGSRYDADRIRLLKRMVDEAWLYDSSAIMIFEHLAENSEETELANHGILLWGNMNYSYNEATMGYVGTSDFSGISYKSRGWENPHLVGYMESHDEERLMFRNIQYGNSSGSYNIKDTSEALNRQKLAAAFFLTIPGPKMIWQFGELGYDYSIDFGGRLGKKPARWDYMQDPRRAKLYKTYQALLKLRLQNEAFQSTNFNLNFNGAMKKIYITHPTMNVAILGNFGVTTGDLTPLFPNAGKWYEYFTGDSIMLSSINQPINLQPGEFRIYTTKKLPMPETDILNDIADEENLPLVFELKQNYPNPFNPNTRISYSIANQTNVDLKIYDILGKEIVTLVNTIQSPGMYNINFNGNDLSSGIYFYQLKTDGFLQTKKMLLVK